MQASRVSNLYRRPIPIRIVQFVSDKEIIAAGRRPNYLRELATLSMLSSCEPGPLQLRWQVKFREFADPSLQSDAVI